MINFVSHFPDSITVREYLSGLKPTSRMPEKSTSKKLFKKSEKNSKKLFQSAGCVLS